MKAQSLCETGSDIAVGVLAAMEQYGEDLGGHITKRICRAGVCRKFMTFHILPDQCTGCGDCVDECGEEAILGKRRFIHVIQQDECIQCGACLEICDEGAIVPRRSRQAAMPEKTDTM